MRTPFFHRSLRSSRVDSITPAPDTPWSLVGSADETLHNQLEHFYWEGIKGELENIIRTLKAWEQPELASVAIEEEQDNHIHGFDAFIDQVSQESRAFAIRYGKKREEWGNSRKNSLLPPKVSYKDALVDRYLDQMAEYKIAELKSGVRKAIEALPIDLGTIRRARMLLQSAGFLDIEKLIEHRPPPSEFTFWKRPAIPQLTLSKLNESWIPRLEPLPCTKCKNFIRGSMFTAKDPTYPSIICEQCYYGNERYAKTYKHCILSEAITPVRSRKICRCRDVPHLDSSGHPRGLFPVIKGENHLSAGGFGSIQCGILKLGEYVALAKYKGLQTIVGLKANKKDNTKPKKISGWRPGKLTTVASRSLHNSTSRTPSESSTSVATEAQADGDIPLFFRKFTEKYPFGNVHMALRVGPLVIENGVSHTKRGALVTVRESPVFHQRFDLVNSCDRCFAVSEGDSGRLLWQQKARPRGLSKRFKAIMKQVVGVPFSGILDNESLENQIVEDIVVASKLPFDDPGLSAADQRSLLDSAIGPLLAKLQALIGWRVKVYMESVSNRLLDPKTKLSWSLTGNNCQSFCNTILEPDLFEHLLNGPETMIGPHSEPLYEFLRTKFDVPIGLTEEYLLKFHFGRHDEADIIDTLLEYWYDWGAFAAPLYKYQDLFPWDCTEAYGKYPTRCGDCNLAKHVWAFPLDSWSMTALHLTRDQHLYAPGLSEPAERKPKTAAWMENRLSILTASYLLTRAAVAMAKTPRLCSATSWLHSKHKGGLRAADPSLSRVKLGGIHRAQPFSHYFEAGAYSHYFITEWALLSRRDQIEAYELMRDGRIKLPDVPYAFSSQSRFEHLSKDGSSSFSGFGGRIDAVGLADEDSARPTTSGLNSFEVELTHCDAGLGGYGPALDAGTCPDGGAPNCGASGCGNSACGGAACGGRGGSCGGGGGGGGCGGGCGGGGGGGGCGGGD
ncbi:hypothetical protein MauCBS54593_007303 [Microsporum audouinii]